MLPPPGKVAGRRAKLTEGAPWAKHVYEVNGKFYAIGFQERRAPDREAFLAEKAELLKQQQTEKAQEVYREWLVELRKQQEVKIDDLGT